MNIRKLKSEEVTTSIELSEFAFQLELTEEERIKRKEMIHPEETFVVTIDDHIAAKMTILPLRTIIQGKEVPMGGVSGVATWPEYRRGGLVKKLLQKGLEEMKENGQVVSYLFPFSIPFYRKYGWELFCDRKFLTIKIEQLPKITTTTGSIFRIKKDPSKLIPIYDSFAQHMNGMLTRDEVWWKERILRTLKGQIAVYKNDRNEEVGYIIYQVKNRTMKIIELVHLSKEAWNGIWKFISNHDSMIDKVELTTFAADQGNYFFQDPKIEQKLEPYFMARIVDMTKFLSLYPFQLKNIDQIILHVHDDFCDWNNGTYIIKQGDSENIVQHFQPTKEGAACVHPPKRGVSCTVQQLTAMLLNYQQPTYLLGSDRDVMLLEQAIPTRIPAFFDFF